MASSQPRLHNEIYDFISPKKFVNKLHSKLVVITGAGGEIGKAIAYSFSHAGARVFLLGRNHDSLKALKEQCIKFGANAVFTAPCDVSKLADCETIIKQIRDTAGEIDVLVNNAGTLDVVPFHHCDLKGFENVLAVNLLGPAYLMRLVIPSFIQSKKGCIINIVSRAGTVSVPFASSYGASKAALIRLTSTAQLELDMAGYEDIDIFAIHPGAVMTSLSGGQEFPDFGHEYPGVAKMRRDWKNNFKDSPYLSGMTCVALAAGVGREALRGRYYDVEQDLEDIVRGSDTIKDTNLYELGVSFMGGLANDGGMECREAEPKASFP